MHYSDKLGVDLFKRKTGESWMYRPRALRTQCNWVKKSVKNYLAKYISKAESKEAMPLWSAPSRYACMARNLRLDALRDRKFCEFEIYDWEQAVSIVEKASMVVAEAGYEPHKMYNRFTKEPLGCVWFLDDEKLEFLREWLKLLVENLEISLQEPEKFCFDRPRRWGN